MRVYRIVFVIWGGIALAQTSPQIASVNGKPVLAPDDAARIFATQHSRQATTAADKQEVATLATQRKCDVIKLQVAHDAREQAKQEFAIAISPQEIEQANKEWEATHDPAAELQKQRQFFTTLNFAASEIDQGQNPDTVYQSLLAPMGVTKNEWEADLVQWREHPESRTHLAQTAATFSKWTPQDVKQQMSKGTQKFLEQRKLDEAVDAQLAAQDPRFRAALAEEQKSTVRRGAFAGSSRVSQAAFDYLKQKRNEFWQARYAQQQVTFNDPILAEQCQLSATVVSAKK